MARIGAVLPLLWWKRIAPLLAGVLVLDLALPLGIAPPMAYAVPIYLCAWFLPPGTIVVTAALASTLTIVDPLVFQYGSLTFSSQVLTNRLFALLLIGTTAFYALREQRWRYELEGAFRRTDEAVKARTRELEEANRELEILQAQAQAKLAAIVQSSDDSIVGMTLEGLVTSWNAGAERIYGYAADEMVGAPVSVLVPEAWHDEQPAILRKIRRGEHVRHYETVRKHKDGRHIDISLTVSPVKDGEGVVVGASSISRDITARKRTEAALRESETRFRIMADSAPVMVWMADPEGKLVFVNKQWLAFTGRSLSEEQGFGWMGTVHQLDLMRSVYTIQASCRQQRDFSMEYRFRRHDGAYRWILNTGVPRFSVTGELEGFVGSCVDLTEQKQTEDQLREAVKERESLLREVHHRVKNNLQVVSSILSLQALAVDDPRVSELFKQCQYRITSISLLHEKLYRAENVALIHMDEYIRTLTGYLYRACGVEPSRVELALEVGDVSLDVETALTCGFIVNELVSNCLKHAFPGTRTGTIRISLHDADDGTYVLRVRDDGIGMRQEALEARSKTLGLQLMDSFAKKMDGRVAIDAEGGTDFQITFCPLHYKERM